MIFTIIVMNCGQEVLSMPQLTETEMSFYELLDKIVTDGKREGEPKPPCSYQLESFETISKGKLRGYMVFALIKFSNEICGKKISEVSWDEVGLIQRYFHSFGYEILYLPDQKILAAHGGNDSQMGFRDYRMWFNPYVR